MFWTPKCAGNCRFALGAIFLVFCFTVTWEFLEVWLELEENHPLEFSHVFQKTLHSLLIAFIVAFLAVRKIRREQNLHNLELQAINDKLRELAITDSVTGAYNHRYFELTLDREWQRMERLGHPISCIMIDLDKFKLINDTYGHQAGDAVLRGLAQLLRSEFREIDIVSRYGGEEFVVILIEKPGHMRGLCVTMERIRKKIEQHKFIFNKKRIKVTASLGGALVPDPKIHTPDELVQAADKAMYRAKITGRNACYIANHPKLNCVKESQKKTTLPNSVKQSSSSKK